MATTGIIPAMTAVFDAIFTWIITAFNSILSLFWAEGALTILGVLLLISLGISLFLLLCNIIQNFFQLRS